MTPWPETPSPPRGRARTRVSLFQEARTELDGPTLSHYPGSDPQGIDTNSSRASSCSMMHRAWSASALPLEQLAGDVSLFRGWHASLRSSAYKRVIADIAIFSIWRCGKSTDAQRRNASIGVNVADGGGRTRISFLCNVPLG